MATRKINLKEVRRRAAASGIFSIAALSRKVPCRRETVYFAIENPARYPRAFRRILEVIGHE